MTETTLLRVKIPSWQEAWQLSDRHGAEEGAENSTLLPKKARRRLGILKQLGGGSPFFLFFLFFFFDLQLVYMLDDLDILYYI